jgi:hypothetical protein
LAARHCHREAQFNRRGVRQLPEKTTDLSARGGAVLDEEAQASVVKHGQAKRQNFQEYRLVNHSRIERKTKRNKKK